MKTEYEVCGSLSLATVMYNVNASRTVRKQDVLSPHVMGSKKINGLMRARKKIGSSTDMMNMTGTLFILMVNTPPMKESIDVVSHSPPENNSVSEL